MPSMEFYISGAIAVAGIAVAVKIIQRKTMKGGMTFNNVKYPKEEDEQSRGSGEESSGTSKTSSDSTTPEQSKGSDNRRSELQTESNNNPKRSTESSGKNFRDRLKRGRQS